jgi:hypothetical protein
MINKIARAMKRKQAIMGKIIKAIIFIAYVLTSQLITLLKSCLSQYISYSLMALLLKLAFLLVAYFGLVGFLKQTNKKTTYVHLINIK